MVAKRGETHKVKTPEKASSAADEKFQSISHQEPQTPNSEPATPKMSTWSGAASVHLLIICCVMPRILTLFAPNSACNQAQIAAPGSELAD